MNFQMILFKKKISVKCLFTDCTFGVSPGVLDGDIVCLIGSKCSEVSCCVNDPETMSDFNAYLSLDPCQFTLLIGVEKYSFEVSLIGFDFGEYGLIFYVL